jgi:predicted transcriptional regulator
MDTNEGGQYSELTAEIVTAYVSNNDVRREDLVALIGDVHSALQRAQSASTEPEAPSQEPAVSVRRSVTPDYIVCLEDGKKFKSLKRHLNNEHGMSPDEYRAKWGLKKDYPMVAPNYSEARSSLAKTMGLGRKAGDAASDGSAAAETPARPAKRARRSKAAAS